MYSQINSSKQRGRYSLETTPAMQSQGGRNQRSESLIGSKKSHRNTYYLDLMRIWKHSVASIRTTWRKVVSFVVMWLLSLVGNSGKEAQNVANKGNEAREKIQDASLPHIVTKAYIPEEEENRNGIAECPLTPVITHHDATPVSRRGSPLIRTFTGDDESLNDTICSHKRRGTVVANTFVMVEYKENTDACSVPTNMCDPSPKSLDTTSTSPTESQNISMMKKDPCAEMAAHQEYVVVEVPRGTATMSTKKKKKKKRGKGRKEEIGHGRGSLKKEQSASDSIENKQHTHSLAKNAIRTPPPPPPLESAPVQTGQNHGKPTKNVSGCPAPSTRTSTLTTSILSNCTFSKEHITSPERGYTGEQQHESELETAWKTASMSAAKLGLDTFSEEASLTRQASHFDASDSMNSSRLSHLSWTTSIDSSLSFGSPLHSTSDKKSTSFKNIKDIWDKTD